MRTSKDTKINDKIEIFMLKTLGYLVLLLILNRTITIFCQGNPIQIISYILHISRVFDWKTAQ